ncbi:beta-hexosaminidase [Bartonella doshiae]|uniref:beta-N-acetylhexosaminidase n=2 Tax=Bartonella doshiae TaxID=33044 RepID=A0A380ZN45_BARDO|nr:glycoside hydrolase family 3 N-terminal domain-containing protein [Bartonella doshiae]SUV50445.1 beta-hexosaminidase [Bartonella doshiae]
MKHIPGHGRSLSDTHFELARVDASLNILEAYDFWPFKNLANLPAAMTAHIVYEAIDDQFPATLSKKVIEKLFVGRLVLMDFNVR